MGLCSAEVREPDGCEQRHTDVRMIPVVVGLGLLASACLGEGSRSGKAASTTGAPTTSLTVAYAVGWGTHLGTCPAGAACSTVTTNGNPSLPIRVARYTLRCGPPAGTYPDPRAACAAVSDYIGLVRHSTGSACACPVEVYQGRLVGIYKGRRVSVYLTPCEACGLGGSAGHDLQTLTPVSSRA